MASRCNRQRQEGSSSGQQRNPERRASRLSATGSPSGRLHFRRELCERLLAVGIVVSATFLSWVVMLGSAVLPLLVFLIGASGVLAVTAFFTWLRQP